MNVKKHCVKRYVERVEGVTDQSEINRIANTEQKRIEESILKMWEYARFVWRGQFNDNVTRNFYAVNNQYILVTDMDNTVIVTMWEADLGLPVTVNRQAVAGMLDYMHDLTERIKTADDEQRGKYDLLAAENRSIDAEIAVLEAKIASLKAKKTVNDQMTKAMQTEVVPLRKEMEQYATAILYNNKYREDILQLKQAG